MHQRKDGTVQNAIEKTLSKVVDPGTGLDVMRMGLIRDLHVSRGEVSFVFRLTSRISPIAFQLATAVRDAVRSVAGVRHVAIRVENSDRAAELELLLREPGAARAARERTPQGG